MPKSGRQAGCRRFEAIHSWRGPQAWLQGAKGEVSWAAKPLKAGDAAAQRQTRSRLKSNAPSEVLLFDLA